MNAKKSKQADLERNKRFFFQIGLVITLSLIIITFEWTSKPARGETGHYSVANQIQMEEIIYTEREEPQLIKEISPVIEIINLVPDEFDMNESFIFDFEANDRTRFKIIEFPVDSDPALIDNDYIKVEIMPTFNGGAPEVEFRKYIAQNLDYPDIAAENYVQGRVIVKFVVNQQGKVVDAEVLSGIDPSLDREALRVILSSPPWKPGIQGGRAVRVMFVFPINFMLK